MYTSAYFYKQFKMKRVYYSGYIPISYDERLPSIGTEVPMMRENRLYQTDWLFRFYGFDIRELLNKEHPNLETDIDPKLSWALRNLEHFPVDINKADRRMLARIPGIGMRSVHKIIQARRYRKLNWEHLKAIGISMNRAQYFLICDSATFETKDRTAAQLKSLIMGTSGSKWRGAYSNQLNLFGSNAPLTTS
jgi:predicted DNA-binding helix-hairpin-helix protein